MYGQLLPIMSSLSGFRWNFTFREDPTQRDQTRHCEYHKEHEHTIDECRHLHYLVDMVRVRLLSQYIKKMNGRLLGVVSKLPPAWFNQEKPRQSFTSFKDDP